MMNLLLETASNAGAGTGNSWWIYVVLIVLVVAMLVLPSITNRRRMKEYNQMLDRLRVGDEVRTIGGVIGRVTKINTKGEVKTFTLETGSKGNKTTMEFDMAAVGTVLKSTYVEPIVEPEKKDTKQEEKVEAKKEEVSEAESALVKEAVKEEVQETSKAEEKPVATKKRTSTKKKN